jgi:phospholipid-binding lipoprotein MlaA
MKLLLKRSPLALAVVLMVALTGCATTGGRDDGDPLEGFNRAVFGFNETLDRYVLEPVSKGYVRITPEPIQTMIFNFVENLFYLNVVLNDLLQGKFRQAGEDVGRFITNSTFGVAGFVDIATPLGMPANDEDCGQTLAVWGAPEGAYIVLPVLGPFTVRDLPDIGCILLTNLVGVVFDSPWNWGMVGLTLVDTRARLQPAVELARDAVDPYLFTREAFRQRRQYLIYDGDPPLEDFDDFDDFDDVDETQGPPG